MNYELRMSLMIIFNCSCAEQVYDNEFIESLLSVSAILYFVSEFWRMKIIEIVANNNLDIFSL